MGCNIKVSKKTYSLTVTISLFAIVISSFIICYSILKEDKISMADKIDKIGYDRIETINPLVLEEANQMVDKSASNISLINEIKRVYNIDVVYGKDTEFLAKSVSASTLYDSKQVNVMLYELIDCLELYPNNILKEIQLDDYTVEVLLIDSFKNDNVALATRDSNNNFRIYISNVNNDMKLERSIHHEIYHILEYYIKLENNIAELYKDWNSYNPSDFVYNEDISLLNSKYVYGYSQGEGNYFVSIYSKTSSKEDRAEVFADTMIASSKPSYYLDNMKAIKNKITLICKVLEQSFDSVKYASSVYWNRYI